VDAVSRKINNVIGVGQLESREETLTKVNSQGSSLEAFRRRLQAVEDVEGPSECAIILKHV
jgi:hypothetical protein